nr:M14 family zinc carboxypeptidase [Mycobacterium sp. IS-1742]
MRTLAVRTGKFLPYARTRRRPRRFDAPSAHVGDIVTVIVCPLGRGGAIGGYLKPDELVDRLADLALYYRELCRPVHLTASPVGAPGVAPNGFPITAVALTDRTVTTPKIPALFIGGAHAREWVPPDALLRFAEKLAEAKTFARDIVYPRFESGGVPYENPADDAHGKAPYVVAAADVAAILRRFDVIVLPLVNPDGRWVSVTAAKGDAENLLWRKNRRSAVAGPCRGVDINRNYDIAWNYEKYYDTAAATRVKASTQPCAGTFHGPSPHSEPETRNVATLIDAEKVEVFVDVHMSGRSVSFPWGMETNQSTERTKSFGNAAYDRQRDGVTATATRYGEFVDNDLNNLLAELGLAMAKEIVDSAGASPVARRRSTYAVSQSAGMQGDDETYTGVADDYAFSRQFAAGVTRRCVAFTVECGLAKSQNPDNPDEDEGGFHPSFTDVYPKIEREVHAALFGLLKHGSWSTWHHP